MINGIRTIYSRRLNKMFGLKFCEGLQSWQEISEESWRAHLPKFYVYSHKDEDNSLNILNNMNYQVSSKKFRQIIWKLFFTLMITFIMKQWILLVERKWNNNQECILTPTSFKIEDNILVYSDCLMISSLHFLLTFVFCTIK